MLTTKEVKGVLVCRKPAKGKEYTADGLPRRGRKIGKVYKTVFDPSGLRVVGFVVRRPDLLWMFKRPEKFLALDAMDASEGVIRATKGADSWDDRAVRRCGLDWDSCIIWEGMRVRTSAGEDLGHVDDISFDPETGAIDTFFLDDGGTARALIGSVEIPADLAIGYKDDYLVVKPEASECKLTGGLAAKAGEATARASIAAREGTKKAGEAASKAVDAGAVGLGKGIGRLKRSFTGFAEGFKEEAPAKKAPASASGSSGARKATSASSGKAGTASSGTRRASSKAATSGAAGSSSASAKGASSAKQATTARKAAPAKRASSSTKSAGQAVGSHLKSAGSMFSDFKKEFDKASKGK